MAKLNRTSLKKIIKECLMEILADAATPPVAQDKKLKIIESKPRPTTDREFLAGMQRKKQAAPSIDVSQITSDPVMAAIFEDTARTTLVEQSANETRTPSVGGIQAGNAGVEHVSQNLDSLFGESAGKWADIAFRGENSKK